MWLYHPIAVVQSSNLLWRVLTVCTDGSWHTLASFPRDGDRWTRMRSEWLSFAPEGVLLGCRQRCTGRGTGSALAYNIAVRLALWLLSGLGCLYTVQMRVNYNMSFLYCRLLDYRHVLFSREGCADILRQHPQKVKIQKVKCRPYIVCSYYSHVRCHVYRTPSSVPPPPPPPLCVCVCVCVCVC